MKVIGYYNSFERQDVLEKLELNALTHINYAFMIPKANGEVQFKNENDVKRVVTISRNFQITPFVSVGGWCDGDIILNNVFEQICSNQDTLDTFIYNIIQMVERFGFEGVDLDWEYPSQKMQSKFCYMINALSDYLHSHGKKISIAIHHSIDSNGKRSRIGAVSDYIISKLDWINVMTYDCHEEKNHSSIELAKKCVFYWTMKRKISKEKVMIGIPFYSKPSQMRYYELVEKNHNNAFKDYIGRDSFNGIHTVQKKTAFSALNCGGLIIWAINYDTTDKYSLLKAIAST